MFDLRLKIVNSRVFIAHGLLEFNLDNLGGDLLHINETIGTYVRVLLENRTPTDEEAEKFRAAVNILIEEFPDIFWFGGHGAHGKDWDRRFISLPDVSYLEDHASVSTKGVWRILPRRYAKQHNQYIKSNICEQYVMIDYIEL